jgi:hypothetical protein
MPFPPRVRDLVLEFKKGIKLDLSSFAVLKGNKRWDSVHRTLKAQTACYQDVDGVLDLSYVPSTAEDIDVNDLLDLSYMSNTAEEIVLTHAPTCPGTYDGDTRGSYSWQHTISPQGTRSCSRIQEGYQT